ncbi:unnamed protein product [Oncorhynchus mykiss]|uniref:Uncharacterized protein n=1 Tax=Oncorhynchus mykiss TaxID=8022 RepID=A0A060Y8Y5_ONCMY|nr:unnamed protein product [Oncorhynchus mykiss]
MLKEAEYRWLFPEEIHQQNEDGGQMDQYLVYGEQYLAVREAVAKAVLEGTVEDIEKKCERCTAPPKRRTLYILLALFREVTSLYRAANTGLHPSPKKCQELEYFIQGSRYLDPKPVRDFAMALVQNRMGELNVHNGRTGAEHVLIELTVHLAAVLLTGTEGVLTPLQQLGLTPNNMLRAFIPTMPEDMLAMAQRVLTQTGGLQALTWYCKYSAHINVGVPYNYKICFLNSPVALILLTFYCSGLNQCFLVVLNKSTWKQMYTPHTHGYGLKESSDVFNVEFVSQYYSLYTSQKTEI